MRAHLNNRASADELGDFFQLCTHETRSTLEDCEWINSQLTLGSMFFQCFKE